MVKRSLKLLFNFSLQDIYLDHFTEKPLVSVVQKKNRDPTISAVTNIHTWFSCPIREGYSLQPYVYWYPEWKWFKAHIDVSCKAIGLI